VLACLGVLLSLGGHRAHAASADAGVSPASGDASSLQPLPTWTPAELPEPQPAEVQRLDALIARLLDPDEATRRQALGALPQVDASWLPAIAAAFERVAQGSNKPALKVLLDKVRQASRTPPDRRRPAAVGAAPDDLSLIVAYPDRSSSFLRPLTEAFAYSRMCEAIGNLEAARRVVAVYTRFGEFARADTERALARMRDTALAALIEARGSPVPRLPDWAKGQLVALGKDVASDAIQVQDQTLRADILRAYGMTRDVETSRLLIAFAASDRATIRIAARQAVVMLGAEGLPALRDAYRKAVGKSAAPDWSWQLLAQELFAAFDRQRLAEVYRALDMGLEESTRGNLDRARAAFDQVLAHDPLFERGALMAPIYLAWGEQHADQDAPAASLALRRAERLAAAGPIHDRALSLRYTLDARSLLERGIVDEVLVERARELDPENARAAALEAELARQARGDRSTFRRYLAAFVIVVLALMGLIVMALRQRHQRRAM
jgi:hypothetical protein